MQTLETQRVTFCLSIPPYKQNQSSNFTPQKNKKRNDKKEKMETPQNINEKKCLFFPLDVQYFILEYNEI